MPFIKKRNLFNSLACFALFLAFTHLVINFSLFKAIDERLAERPRPFYTALRYFSLMIFDNYGLRWVSFLVLLIIALLAYRKKREYIFLITPVVALLAVNACVAFFKFTLNRSKPTSGNSIFFTEGYHSYPSGHMVNIVVMYLLVFYIIKKITLFPIERVRPYLYINFVMSSGFFITSVERNTHWLTDLVAGVLLGFAIYFSVVSFMEKYSK